LQEFATLLFCPQEVCEVLQPSRVSIVMGQGDTGTRKEVFSTDGPIDYRFHGILFRQNAYFTSMLAKKIQLPQAPYQSSASGPRCGTSRRHLLCPPTIVTDRRLWHFSCLYVCISVCHNLSVLSHVSKTTHPNFTNFSVHVNCARSWIGPASTTVQYVMYFRFYG